ncbi:MAG TPA: JAB domain-containing protein [Chromatiaceae bacterium]|nr:JAB domain-containing protein [Chromatiaceae bacterium]HIN83251.1 JAB domain-containing protein [Chromatiales bacterium]
MTIKDWPAAERPREKLLSAGVSVLSDAELLAIFLGSGTRDKNAVEMARTLLASTTGLRPFMAQNSAEMLGCRGIGPATCATLTAALEIGRRCLEQTLTRGDALSDPDTAARFVRASLANQRHEVFAAGFMDSRNRLIKFEILFHGTIDRATVHPRRLVEKALQHNAAAVLVAHNHPSGVAEPSQSDRDLTQRLQRALELIDVRLLDHFVVGDGETVSFAQRGWI